MELQFLRKLNMLNRITLSLTKNYPVFASASVLQRSFFSDKLLNMDLFLNQKAVELKRMNLTKESFIEKLTLDCDSSSRIPANDIKQMCFLSETDDDLILFNKMLRLHCRSDNPNEKTIMFRRLVIDPLIMRMYYHLNKPIEAYNNVKDPVISKLFIKLSSYFYLLCLLYKNKLYDEIIEIFKIVVEKQFRGHFQLLACISVVNAACYKLDTDESFEYSKDIFKISKEFSHIDSPFLYIFYLHSIKRKDPSYVMKMKRNSDSVMINLKIAACLLTKDIQSIISLMKPFSNSSVNIVLENWKSFKDLMKKVDSKELKTIRTINYETLELSLEELVFEYIQHHFGTKRKARTSKSEYD